MQGVEDPIKLGNISCKGCGMENATVKLIEEFTGKRYYRVVKQHRDGVACEEVTDEPAVRVKAICACGKEQTLRGIRDVTDLDVPGQ